MDQVRPFGNRLLRISLNASRVHASFPATPAALYARVSSDRQDVDLEYVDEAESGRIADRPQFRNMIDEGGKATAPFQVILIRQTQ